MVDFAWGQKLVDLGAVAPTAGSYDISQFGTNGNQQLTGAFNYFTDNLNPPGQTFTIGTNLVLTSLSLKTGCSPLNSGNGGLGPQPYQLQLFSVTNNQASLLATYVSSNNFSYNDGDWLKWTNLFLGLNSNSVYAYTFSRISNGYDGLAVGSGTLGAGNYYRGGEAVLIPTNGGTVITQASHNFDAVFNVGLMPVQFAGPTNGNINLEAENGTLSGIYVSTSAPGYSGTGYVTGFTDANSTVSWSLPAHPACMI